MKSLSSLLLALILTGFTVAQEASPAPAPEKSPDSETPVGTLPTLRSLVDSQAALKAQLELQNQLSRSGQNETVKEAAKKEVAALQTRYDQAAKDFEAIATGINTRDAQPVGEVTTFNVTEELTLMVQPLIRELKAATEQPRLIEQLRAEVNSHNRRLEEVRSAVRNIQTTLGTLPKKETTADATLRKALQAALEKWKTTEKEAIASVEVIKHRLEDVLARRKTIFQIASQATQGFFLTRGRNIFLAVLALGASYAVWRWAYRWVVRFSPWHKRVDGRLPFTARVIDISYHSLSAVLGTVAALTVLYSTGDWLLLGLCLIALIGLVIGARTAVPKYYRHARLLLNFGEVREGERIVYQGLPWLVKSLNMFTELQNPALRNGRLRVPLDQLSATTSRPLERDEPWFPAKEGDWVMLQDNTFGKCVTLTPENVQLVFLGGSHKLYPTNTFINQNPQNLSGGFRLTSILRLDHQHRDEAIKHIPSLLGQTVRDAISAELKPNQLRSLTAEYRSSTTVSLEFEILADFAGEVAEHYESLRRDLQRHALECANQNHWKLATQLIPLAG